MRLFIATSLTDELKNRLKAILDNLTIAIPSDPGGVKWVKPEQIHFTLKFLGECAQDQVPDIVRGLEASVENISPFSVKIGGVGCFPERGPVRIVWLGLIEGKERMRALASQVESGCSSAGFPSSEHPFSAHLTLGRIKNLKDNGKLRALLGTFPPTDLGELKVDSLELIHSILSSEGPTYTRLKLIQLHSDKFRGGLK